MLDVLANELEYNYEMIRLGEEDDDTERTTEMRRKGQKEGVPAPSAAQGRISRSHCHLVCCSLVEPPVEALRHIAGIHDHELVRGCRAGQSTVIDVAIVSGLIEDCG